MTHIYLPFTCWIICKKHTKYSSIHLTQLLMTCWSHQMETFSALLALCTGNSPVSGEFPSQRPVMRSFGVFFDRHLNKRLSKQSWGWWFETPSRSLWRQCNDTALECGRIPLCGQIISCHILDYVRSTDPIMPKEKNKVCVSRNDIRFEYIFQAI